jgi:putative hydrolase of the HAD superfamily
VGLADIRAVAFDLDNTLWDIEPVIERAEARVHEWLREHFPLIPQRFPREAMRAARAALAAEQPHRAHDLTWLRTAALARHARECGYSESLAERAFEVFFAARNRLEPYPDVQPALVRLRTRFRLATLSNGNADLGRIGLAAQFSVSLNARQVGAAKPDPRCFEQLSRALAVAPHELLYVGDDPRADVEGARRAGLATAWLNRTGRSWPPELVCADLVAADCRELAELLLAIP